MQDQYMENLLLTVVLLPLFSALVLIFAALFSVRLTKQMVGMLGVGSIAVAACCVFLIKLHFSTVAGASFSHSYANWIEVGDFKVAFGLYLDALSLVMISIITGVGLLIHLYSVGFMQKEPDFQRFFIYLNLFISAMLVLVLADNLLMLFLGWEGVGLCSYLLIGFWHQKTVNNLAANKAFIMTRIGDTGMAIGLLLMFVLLGSLDIQQVQLKASELWPLATESGMSLDLVTICCLLLLAGAVGKSGQLPLHSWLPDAMAGPTPVSALIHAATMVTAGVYLIARFHPLFNLSPLAMTLVAVIGAITLLIAATSALMQNDIKRILAYSTISQIGYMFLALGAGAYSAAVFHLMTHAFFKALLFLAAGALIYSMQHQHNIFRMGGLAKKLPFICGCFLSGCAALAALPLMSGFFSKELILEKLLEQQMYVFWAVAILGAFITALYSFKLFFVVFLGPVQQQPDSKLSSSMLIPLGVLLLLSIFGGIQPQSLIDIFASQHLLETGSIETIEIMMLFAIAVPIIGVITSWILFKKQIFGSAINSAKLRQLHQFLYTGWQVDWLYNKLFTQPFIKIARSNQEDFIDKFYLALMRLSRACHGLVNLLQNGQLRWYSASLVLAMLLAFSLINF